MNAAFEDCLLLSEIMAECAMDTTRALPEFSRRRVAAGAALADLSYANYTEMRHHTGSSLFLFRKKVESVIARCVPAWIPQYTMVAFTRIPYDEAVRRARRQDAIMRRLGAMAIAGMVGAVAVGLGLAINKRFPDALPKINCDIKWPAGAGAGAGSASSSGAARK